MNENSKLEMLDYGVEDAFWNADIIGNPQGAQKLEESLDQAGKSME